MHNSLTRVLAQESGTNFQMYNGDCIPVAEGIPDNSIDYTISSPPFENLYIYSDSEADMGNSSDSHEFFEHFKFLIEELHRITVKGRLCSIHCKDLPRYRGRDGAAGLADFPGKIIAAFEEVGWQYHSRVTIWKDPVIEMTRTKNHGLLYKNLREYAEVSRQGMADYLLTFRKWEGLDKDTTQSDKPVKHSSDIEMQYYGVLPLGDSGDERDISRGRFYWHNLKIWQRYASPVWMDIDQTDVLNFQVARDNADEKHICPLQLGVIRRGIDLWTNPGDVVFDPFGGIGSTPVVALEMHRKAVAVELKPGYFDIAVKNLKEAELKAGQMDMFTFAGVAL